jgi:hypothetical protein
VNGRCPACYRRLPDGGQLIHDLSGDCRAKNPPPKAKKAKKSQAGYVAPSRAGRPSRAEYDAARATTAEE